MTSPIGGASGLQQILAMRQEMIDKNQVLQSLRAGAGTGAAPADAPNAPVAPNGPAGGFTDALKTALDGVNATQQRASDISAAYERGEVTDVAKVMLARQEAGIAFEATLQVRNKLLSAYLDILRMGV
ncbi:MAG: flagellar hook-basal body complex protein FliE [Sphingobium sp.]